MTKLQFKIKNYYFLLAVLSFSLLVFSLIIAAKPVIAAKLYLEPYQGQYQAGDTFIVEIKINTDEDECINTVKADLKFSQTLLEAVDFSQGNSILTLWVKPPLIDQTEGLIFFIGGVPGGYCGKIPGELGKSNLLGKIIFRVVSRLPAQIFEENLGGLISRSFAQVVFQDDSQVLLNDGLATPAKLTTKGAVFTILSEEVKPSKDEWQEELEKDDIPPESFKVEINQEATIFEGKYFIIFSTTDKQTGIDRYEVKEGKRDWQEVISPYLLEDQSLQNKILVKAIDKADNERIVEIKSPKKPLSNWIIILILVGTGIIFWIIRRIFTKLK